MKKLVLALVAVLSCAFAVSPDYFSVNVGAKNGKFLKDNTPNYGYITIVEGTKPSTVNVQTGTIVLYGKVDNGAVDLMWIAKDVSGNITSGNVTGI